MIKSRLRWLYAALAVLHCIIAAIAFKDFRRHPMQSMFCAEGDGLKNYFTLQSYVQSPVDKHGLFYYGAMNYPEGEYVWTTDNTPLFSIPFRAFCQYIYDASAYTIPLYNIFIILNIIICGLLLFALFRKVSANDSLSFLLALILPWVNVMVLRIWRGHMNLSLSSFIVAALLLMLLWHARKGNARKQIILAVWMAQLMLIATFAHGYYLPLLGCFFAFSLLAYSWYHRRETPEAKRALLAAMLVPVSALAIFIITIKATDPWFSQRPKGAQGYDMVGQKLELNSLYSPYDFHKTKFPFRKAELNGEPEIAGYLSHIGMFGLLLLGIYAILRPDFRNRFKNVQQDFIRHPLYGPLSIAAMMLLIMSFADHIRILGDKYVLDNLLNPFYWLGKVTRHVTQFRSMGRFFFPAYFIFYIWLAYTLAQLFKTEGRRFANISLILLFAFGALEIKDFVDKMQSAAAKPNYLSREYISVAGLDKLRINASEYQCVLPFPIYLIGSEDMSHSIDDIDEWGRYTYQLLQKTRLPTLAVKLARTREDHSIARTDLIAYDSLWPGMRAQLNQKPVLIAINRKYQLDTQYDIPGSDSAQKWFVVGNDFINRHPVIPVDSADGIVLFKWYPLQDSVLR